MKAVILRRRFPALEKYIASGNTTYLQEANYSLKAAKGQVAEVREIPLNILKHNYDTLAKKYNDIYLKEPQLSPQYKLCNALNAYLNEIGKPFGNRLLDLGSGTGIIGKTLKEFKVAGHVTGVELSPKMSEIAVTLKNDNMPTYNQSAQHQH
jgi:predicted TPR repeat methyltransferase